MPARYVKIEDLNMADLEMTNAQRREEIEDHKAVAKQLEKQHKLFQKDCQEAKAARDNLQNHLSCLIGQQPSDQSNTSKIPMIHPSLSLHASPIHNSAASTSPSFTMSAVANTTKKHVIASAPKDALSNFLQNTKSPYDD